MAANLYTLPFEILIEVCKHFNPSDLVSVVRVNKALYQRLRGNQPSRFILKTVIRWSREADAAFAGEITFWEALNRFYNRTQAFAKASPYSVAVLPGIRDFVYENGVLLYVLNHEIHILDTYRDVTSEKLLNLDAASIILSDQWNADNVFPLFYHSDILVLEVRISGGSRLILLDLRKKRVKINTHLRHVKRLVVRHNGLYLFVAFYSEHYDWHWAIRKFDLRQESEIGSPTILDGFGNRHNVCFEIFDDHLFGVSSHMTETELRSNRCFYKWICLAPTWSSPRMTAKQIFRRYHDLHEGVLMHAELSLQIDEDTGRPMILDCRHERRPLEEISCRTCYGELLPSPKEFNDDEQTVNLPLLGLTKEELRAYRDDKLMHPEYSSDSCERLDFSPSNTMYSYYNLSARTFLDLINDPVPNSQVAIPSKRFRLRFNSHKCTASDKKHVSIQLWPSDDNVEILNPLCTSFVKRDTHAKANERTIIYSMTSDHTAATVLISFDPKIRFSHMYYKRVEILNEWVRIEPATRFRRVWDRKTAA